MMMMTAAPPATPMRMPKILPMKAEALVGRFPNPVSTWLHVPSGLRTAQGGGGAFSHLQACFELSDGSFPQSLVHVNPEVHVCFVAAGSHLSPSFNVPPLLLPPPPPL